MRKRTLPIYIFLNCLTLGIYGFIVANQMSKEIDRLCKGDKQEPAVGYGVAAVLRFFVPVFGAIYYNYWWYQQTNRLKLNANRYGLTIKESGTDTFLMRTVLQIPLAFVTALEVALAFLIPAILIVLFTLIHPVIGLVFELIFAFTLNFFIAELTAGANISNFYLMKNLNRFAEVYRNGAKPFDPMAYEYYPSVANNYPKFVPQYVCAKPAPERKATPDDDGITGEGFGGSIIGLTGSCAGYRFDINAGEEIVIGKDPLESMVVIDAAYKEVSRKHVGVCYDFTVGQYRVVDYSSNGTWANGLRLEKDKTNYLPSGTELKLANGKNTFRLG